MSFHEAGLTTAFFFLTCCYIWPLSQSVYSISSEEEEECGAQQSSTEFELEPLGVNWMIRFPLCCTQAFERSISNTSGGRESQPSFQGCLWLGATWGSPVPSLKRVRFLSAASGRKRNDDSIQTGVYSIASICINIVCIKKLMWFLCILYTWYKW